MFTKPQIEAEFQLSIESLNPEEAVQDCRDNGLLGRDVDFTYLRGIRRLLAGTAAEVVRQAMGQLLEYGYRSGGLEPVKLFVVGEPALDEVTRRFVARLKTDFKLHIEYLQVELPAEDAIVP